MLLVSRPNLTYQFDIEAGGMEPFIAVITANHVHGLWHPAKAKQLVTVHNFDWLAAF